MRKNFLKISAIILALAPAISMGSQEGTKNIDEFLLWGSYYKFKNHNKSTYTFKQTGESSNEGNGENGENGGSIPPEPVIPARMAVVKENDVIKAWKDSLGDPLHYIVGNDIFSTDKTALWMTDLNTEVVNDKVIESAYTNAGTENFSVAAENNAVFINNGKVGGTHGGITGENGAEISNNNLVENQGDYGIFLKDSNAYNNSTGKIFNSGDYGIFASTRNSTAVNEGIIENGGSYGMATDGGKLTNTATGKIKNGNNYGMYAKGSGSRIENEGLVSNTGMYGIYGEENSEILNNITGIIENTGDYGISAINSTALNKGTVKNGGDYGIYVKGSGSRTENEGLVSNTGMYGIYGEENSEILNNITGVIENTGDYGISALNSTALNKGTVKNGGDYGIYVKGSGSRTENEGLVSNTGMYGIYGEENSEILNNITGIIENTGDYGISALNSTALNKGTVKNQGNYGMYAEGAGSQIENDGIIENSGSHGMYAVSDSTAVNTANGIIKNAGDIGMAANRNGSSAVNNGVIENIGNNGMYISNSAEGTNNGIIRNKNEYGMRAINSSYIVNKGQIINEGANGILAIGNSYAVNDTAGIIENIGNYGLSIGSGSTGENKGVIRNAGTNGIYAINGGLGINRGTVENTGVQGMYATETDSKVINYGIIKNTSTHGMYGTNNAQAINESTGIIENQGNYGIVAGSNSIGINNGTIKNLGTNGMYATNAGEIANNGRIENNGNYGMQVTGAGSKGVNGINGVIANKGNSGLYGINGAQVVNKGKIENSGDYGMHLNNATGVNEGTIHLTGDNKIGVHINNNATFINNGIIRVDGNNVTGIKAMNNSVVQIAQNSQIILNGNAAITQGSTDYSDKQSNGTANSNSAGKAYNIDATSTLINAGTISAYGTFTVEDTGKFVLDTGTGRLNAGRVNLEGNLYVNANGTAGSFEDTYKLNSLNTEELSGDGTLVSDSLLFNGKLEKNTSGKYDIVMERKDFSEVFSSEFGKVLEDNYNESGNKNEKSKIYDSLKMNIASKEKALTAENELTGKSIVSNLMYQEFRRNRILENGVNDLLENRDPSADKGVYVNVLGGKEDADSNDGFTGYKNRDAGVIFGMMKKAGEKISFGGFAGYLNSDTDYKDEGNSNQKTDTLSLKGALVADLSDKIKWRNILGYNYGNTDTKRKITYDKSYTELNGSFNSWSAELDTNIEYKYDVNKSISLIPLIGMNVSYLHQDSYSESGSDGYNLNVDSASGTSVRAKAGARMDLGLYENKNTSLKLVPSILYSYETANPYKTRDVRINAFDGMMYLESKDARRDNLDLGIGVEYNYNSELVFYGQYKREMLNDSGDEKMSLGFKVYF